MAYEYQSFATLGVNLNRQNYGALDISQVFTSQADLNYYISKGAITEGVSAYWYDATDAENIKKVVPYPYAGQYLALVDNTTREVTAYILVEKADGTFETKEVGKAPIGDDKSIEVDATGVISLKGFNDLTEAQDDYLPRVKWVAEVPAVGEEGAEGYVPAVPAHAEIEWVPVDQVVEGDGNTKTTLSVKIPDPSDTSKGFITLNDTKDDKTDTINYEIEVGGLRIVPESVSYDGRNFVDYNIFLGNRATPEGCVTVIEREEFYDLQDLVGFDDYVDEENPENNKEATGLVHDIRELQRVVGEEAQGTEQSATGLFAELEKKANASDVYTKEAANALLNNKADKTTLADYYTKVQADEKFAVKADTLADYGITDAYTKDETNSAIKTEIAKVDHLKRSVVKSIEDIDVTAADATQYIYMVPAGVNEISNQDIYDEYMVIEKVKKNEETGEETITKELERLGSWQVDLSGYVTTSALNATLSDYVTTSALNTTLNTTLSDYYTKTDADNAIKNTIDSLDFEVTNTSGLIGIGLQRNGVTLGESGTLGLIPGDNVELSSDVDNNITISVPEVYTKDEVDTTLNDYATKEELEATNEEVAKKANAETVNNALALKADADKVYTKDAADALFNAKANADNVYTKDETYTKTQTDAAITAKIQDMTGGESAADVLLSLNDYKKANDTEIYGVAQVADWTKEVENEDGSVTLVYEPDYTTNVASRIDIAIEDIGGLSQRLDPVVEKLSGIKPGAEVNVINSVDNTEFEIVTDLENGIDRQLRLESVSVSKLTGLDAEEIAVTKEGDETEGKLRLVSVPVKKIEGFGEEFQFAQAKDAEGNAVSGKFNLEIKAVSVSKITGLDDKLNTKLKDYVTNTTYSTEFGTYADLKHITGDNSKTAIDEINALIDALTWVDMQ